MLHSITLTDPKTRIPLTFVYSGGEYIKVYRRNSEVDVIGVFDYAKHMSIIKSQHMFSKTCREYISDGSAANIILNS